MIPNSDSAYSAQLAAFDTELTNGPQGKIEPPAQLKEDARIEFEIAALTIVGALAAERLIALNVDLNFDDIRHAVVTIADQLSRAVAGRKFAAAEQLRAIAE